jgi:hypothetical protein
MTHVDPAKTCAALSCMLQLNLDACSDVSELYAAPDFVNLLPTRTTAFDKSFSELRVIKPES